MPPGVKEQLGLSDPKSANKNPTTNTGSTEQADKFKADYQASAGKINESLQYTAAYAQKSKHDPHAAKRDTLCQAYQVALGRIDPTNPSVAKGAIDQVLSTAKQLQTTTETLKTTTEKAYNAWTARQSDLETLTNQVREMVDWGHEKAAPLQQVLDAINSKSKERAYEEALTALEQLQSKAGPIYADYQKQKAAQEEYEPALQALQPRLDQAKTCTFKALVPMQQELCSAADQMQQAADKKDYVTALAQLRTLEGNVGAFETKLAEIEAKKAEYEQARAALDPKLGEASTCQYKALAELDQHIADLTTRTDAAASEEDYEQAVTLVGELTIKVDEKITRAKEIEAKKQEYEAARQALDPKLTEASTSQYKTLAELDQQIADGTTKTDAAVAEEDYEQAVTLVGELSTKVDEKVAKVKELEEKKAAYETLAQELSGRMPNQSEADYPSLEPLQTELVSIEDQMKAAADAEDYDKALEHANSLKTKLEEYETKKKELEEKKAEYEALAQELAGRMPNQSDADYPSLGPLQTELVSTEDQMKAAADAKDFEKALEHGNNLKTKLEEYETKKKELEEKKAEYDKANTAAMAKVKECSLTAKAVDSLDDEKLKLQPLQKTMEASAAAKDWAKALTDAQALDAAAQKYLDAVAKIETKTKKTVDTMTKELDGLSGVAKREKAREWAKKLTPDELKTMSQDTRNMLMKELTHGGVSDEDKAALNEIYKVRALDPDYEKAAAKTREEFLKKLQDDPEMAEARKNWGTMSVDKKMALLEKVAKVHTGTYGTEKIDGTPDLTIKPVNEDPYSNGAYQPGTGVMEINTNPNAAPDDGYKAKFNDFDRAMDLVDHEANHRYQEMLIKKFESGKLAKTDPLYKQAEAFAHNDKYYASGDDIPGVVYYNQPQESASRVSGAAVEGAHIGEDERHHHHHH